MPLFRWNVAILGAAAIALTGLMAGSGVAAWAGTGTAWSIEGTPEAVVANGTLAADACTGTDQCIAVGSSDTSAGTSALAESWDGTAWSIRHVPMPPGGTHSALDAVSCSAATACTAVGYYTSNLGEQVTLAERWDGATWSVQPTAVPPGAARSLLAGVSCGSATSCVAVGGDETRQNAQDRLAYSWNGTRWTLVEASSPPGGVYGFLAGVSCATATACIAVGNELSASSDDIVTLAQAWDGSTWKVLAVPDPAGAIVSRLYGVSCSAAATCTAVGASIQAATRSGAPRSPRGVRPGAAARRAAWGADGRGAWPGPGVGTAASTGGPLAATLAEAWNGTTWAIQATPNPAGTTGIDELAGVSCMSATSCTAMGSASAVGDSSAGTLGETWNGTAWTLVTVPGPGPSFNALAGVSCTPAACLAVGYYRDSTDTHLALAVASAGGGWAIQPAPSPPGAVPSILAGVSCGAASACAAVGFYHNSPGTTRTLAEAWNGTAWRVEQAPDSPALPQDTLASVSCTSATACMAVGRAYGKRSGTTLAESWNGTSWALRPGPALPGTFGQLSGVSCTSVVACTAVGSYDNGTLPLAESWNGTAWTLQQVPAPAGGFDPQLESVSCTSPSACTAVGNYESPGTLNLLAERWNGTAWTIQATPAADGTLYGVSCGSATICTAVGNAYSPSAGSVTLALQWRGGTWKEQMMPFIAGVLPSLYGVSCRSPRDCAAVGGYGTDTNVAVTLAEAWNGTAWTVQATPRPPTGTGSVLAGVSSGPAAGFTAVGSHLTGAQVSATLAETGPG